MDEPIAAIIQMNPYNSTVTSIPTINIFLAIAGFRFLAATQAIIPPKKPKDIGKSHKSHRAPDPGFSTLEGIGGGLCVESEIGGSGETDIGRCCPSQSKIMVEPHASHLRVITSSETVRFAPHEGHIALTIFNSTLILSV